MAPIKVTKTVSLEKSTEEFRIAVRRAVDTALLETVDYLQRNSPRGVSPVGESLRGRWDVTPARKRRGSLQVLGSITNNAEGARFRILGRGPGKFPPFQEGSPLERWAAVKGIPAFLLARKIATEGTARWREGAQGNIMKQDPRTGKLASNSPVVVIFDKTLREELDRLRL